jgi:hypothetical protein
MRNVTGFSVVASVLLAFLAGVIMTFTRVVPVAAYEPLSPRLLPGSPFPRSSWCERHYMDPYETTLSCHARQSPDTVVYFNFDTKEQRITRTYLNTPGKTVGELVIAWGTPLGYRNDPFGTFVYWHGRFAYTSDRSFKPESQATFIAYSTNTKWHSHWPGFRDLKRDTRG